MADEESIQPSAGSTDQDEPKGPQFGLQRIYLKDSSFESPGSPTVFQGQWNPKINFDIKTKHEKSQDDLYEVVLVLTVEAQIDEKVAFLVEVHQAGMFAAQGFDGSQIEQMLATVEFVICSLFELHCPGEFALEPGLIYHYSNGVR